MKRDYQKWHNKKSHINDAVPLTKREKKSEYYFTFFFSGRGKNTAILSQIRLIDARRLDYKIGEISKTDFQILTNKLKALLP